MSNVQVAQARYVLPAQEKTKQVRIIGYVVVAVAIGAFVAICIRPEGGGSIATVAGIVVGVFGGLYTIEQFSKKPTERGQP